MSTYCTNFRLFFHSLPHYQHTFFTFTSDTVCWSSKPLCWSVGTLHT